jgi:hypothetical protein
LRRTAHDDKLFGFCSHDPCIHVSHKQISNYRSRFVDAARQINSSFFVFAFGFLRLGLSTSGGREGKCERTGARRTDRLTASDGDYASKVGVHWQPIRGATTYRIFRNTINDSATATDVGTTAANYFFDTSAVIDQQYFYWVRGENAQTVGGFSNADQGIRAVGIDSAPPISPLQPPVAPTGNPVTAAKAYLGKTLFWDEQLSSTKTVACGTCHRPAEGGSDPRTSDTTRNPAMTTRSGLRTTSSARPESR